MAPRKAPKQEQAIKCVNCRHSAEPEGMPIVIRCTLHGRKLVGEALRRCQFYDPKK